MAPIAPCADHPALDRLRDAERNGQRSENKHLGIGSEPQNKDVRFQDRKRGIGPESEVAEREMDMIKRRLNALGYID